MTDRIALVLALAITGLIGFDIVVNGGETLLFLLRKCAQLVEYLAFWR